MTNERLFNPDNTRLNPVMRLSKDSKYPYEYMIRDNQCFLEATYWIIYMLEKGVILKKTPLISVNPATRQCEIAKPTPIIDKLQNRLSYLTTLKEGWAVEGSKPIIPQISEYVRMTLSELTDEEILPWSLFPDVHGYLVFNYSDEDMICGITVTPEEIIYFRKAKGTPLDKGELRLTTENLVKAIKK